MDPAPAPQQASAQLSPSVPKATQQAQPPVDAAVTFRLMPVTRVGAQATRTTAAHAAKTSTSPRRGTHSPSGSTSPSRTTALALEGFGAPIPAVTPGTGLLQGDSEDPPSEDELISSEDDSSSGGDDDDEARNTLLHHPNAVIANTNNSAIAVIDPLLVPQDYPRVRCAWEGCDKSFSREADRERHVRNVHRAEKHACHKCGVIVGRADALIRHQGKNCRGTFGQPVRKFFRCTNETCNKIFASNRSLARHMNTDRHDPPPPPPPPPPS